ncbi:hypothetical protein C368_04577 [Cryptococcus neoformans 125.91]|nr:hypothetical protein C368_04577 [Cryptococcus neoformans var. grubii 125.91]
MASMLERLMAKTFPKEIPPADDQPDSTPYRPRREPLSYEIPDPKGTPWLLKVPDEVLERIFSNVDRVTFVRCHRVCSQINNFLSGNASMKLRNLLQTSSLILNSNALLPDAVNSHLVPPSKAQLLDTLRERLTRFRTFSPKSEETVKFQEYEGRLYEFLEGVLVRSVPIPYSRQIGNEIGVYEFGKMGEWEDVKNKLGDGRDGGGKDRDEDDAMDEVIDIEEDEEFGNIRRTHKFGFQMLDFAFDPGQDLFVVAEYKPHPQDPTINLHLFTLSTFQPHPRAKEHILTWPSGTLYGRAPSLGFQICDDGLFVLKNHHRGSKDMLCGWQWTTGRLAVTLIAPHTSTFESFICLTPSSFAIPSVSTTLNPDSEILGDLTDPSDLIFSHHLNIYAFPPLSSTTVNEHEPVPPPHTATHVTTIDLPEFVIDFENDLPPPRMTIRADPAPRYNLPIHPIGSPQPFIPDPESGIVVLEFYCQPTEDEEGHLQTTHYVLFVRKKTLLGYLPAPTSPLLFSAFPRPAPVVPFANIAPKVRMLGPHQYVPSWVCYVYQDRYVTRSDVESEPCIQLYDFDPMRVRQAQFDPELKDGQNAFEVITEEADVPSHQEYRHSTLIKGVKTGAELPCTVTELELLDDGVHTIIIDAERIIAFDDSEDENDELFMRVMEF